MIDVIKEFFNRLLLGGTIQIQTDNFDLGTIPFYIRYIELYPPADGIYNWNGKFWDPGHLSPILQHRERVILNKTGIATRVLNAHIGTAKLDSPGAPGTIKARLLYAGINPSQGLNIPPGGSITCKNVKGIGKFPKRWGIQVTQASGDITT